MKDKSFKLRKIALYNSSYGKAVPQFFCKVYGVLCLSIHKYVFGKRRKGLLKI